MENLSPFARLIDLVKFASTLNMGECTYEVKVQNLNLPSGFVQTLTVHIHNPSAALLQEARDAHGATTDGWTDCSASGFPENVYRSWDFSPEEGINFVLFERAPDGKLLGDLPVEETRAFRQEAMRRSEEAKEAALKAASAVVQ